MDSKGPSKIPEYSKSFVICLVLRTNINKKIVPRKVLMPTNDIELTSDVLIIKGIDPQQIANKLMRR